MKNSGVAVSTERPTDKQRNAAMEQHPRTSKEKKKTKHLTGNDKLPTG